MTQQQIEETIRALVEKVANLENDLKKLEEQIQFTEIDENGNISYE